MSKQPQTPAKPDIGKMTATLRLQTCELLRLNPDKLLPADEVLVARVGSLRVLVSDLEAAQLRGEQISVASYVEASEALEKLLRDAHHVEVTAEGDPRALRAAREKMFRLMGLAMSENDDEGYARNYERDTLVEGLQAEIASLKAQLEARTTGYMEKLAPAQTVAPATNATAAEQTVPPTTNNVVPIREPASSPVVVSENYGSSLLSDLNRRAY